MPSAKTPKKDRTKRHHKAVLKVLKEVLSEETWKHTYGDQKLAELIKEKGCYASHPIVYSVRIANKIGDSYERKMALFAASKKGSK